MTEKIKITDEHEDGILEQSDRPQTACRDCVFAQYDGNTQIGCKLGKLDLLKENGGVITEVYDDSKKEYYVISDRFCVFWRRPSWLNKDEVKRFGAEETARKEVQARFAAIIYINDKSSLEDIEKTVISLINQNLQPRKLIVANNSPLKPSKLVSLGKDFSVNLLFPKQGGESKTYWKIEQIKEDKASFSRCVDIAIKGVSANEQNYYCSFVAGFQVPKDFIHKIDVALNDDMKRFLLLTAQGNNGQVAQVHMHKSIQGNYTKPFLDKMKTVTEEQKCPQLIQKVTDIVPSMIQ